VLIQHDHNGCVVTAQAFFVAEWRTNMAEEKNVVRKQRPGESLNLRIMQLTKELHDLYGEQCTSSSSEVALGASLVTAEVTRLRRIEASGERLLRLKEVLSYIPVGKSTWWGGVKSGRYPAPVRNLGPRITAWTLSSILQLVTGNKEPYQHE
jgi:predicted DNA-binding transcriptional regulator AlpA